MDIKTIQAIGIFIVAAYGINITIRTYRKLSISGLQIIIFGAGVVMVLWKYL